MTPRLLRCDVEEGDRDAARAYACGRRQWSLSLLSFVAVDRRKMVHLPAGPQKQVAEVMLFLICAADSPHRQRRRRAM